jgi:hypothetical protein
LRELFFLNFHSTESNAFSKSTRSNGPVLLCCFKPLLTFIISELQKDFIKGRFIGENTRLLYDLMHYLEQHNKTGPLLLVDFEKAFDSVKADHLVDSLFLEKKI